MQSRWQSTGLLVLLAVITVSACSPAAAPVPTAAATAVPTDAPTTAPTEPAAADPHACPQAMHGMQLFTNQDAGFCVLIPDKFTGKPNDTQAASFVGPREEIEGDIAPLGWIVVSDAGGKTASEAAASEIAQVNGIQSEPKSITLGGEPAVMVDNMPGQDLTRKVFVVHGGKLYVLSFTPADPSYKHYDSVQALYEAVTGTFVFTK